jgi:hypothetical protein
MNTIPTQIQPRQSTPPLAPIPLDYSPRPTVGLSLFSTQAVGIATFLGSPLAGCVILAINYHRLGRTGCALVAMLCGGLVTAALIGFGFALSDQTPGFLLAFLPLVLMMKLARSLQGEIIDRHLLVGGKVVSLGYAALIGLVTLLAVFCVVFLIVFIMTPR